MTAQNQSSQKNYRLVIGSKNRKKSQELRKILSDLPVEIVSLADFGEIDDVVEDGLTFRENAVKKAQELTALTGEMVLADDSGLEVDALDGVPGVHSARFAGPAKRDVDNVAKLLKMMQDIPEGKRKAQFRCVIAVATPGRLLFTTEGIYRGSITNTPRGENGFGYDPVFFSPQHNRTFAELDPVEKNSISHRYRALVKAKEKLKAYFSKK